MDLFELVIFALIAGSGLIGEMLKKRRQREAREAAERAKAEKRASEQVLEPMPTVGSSSGRTRSVGSGPSTDPYSSNRPETAERVDESWDPFGDGDSSLEEDVFDLETILQDTLFGGSGKRRDRAQEAAEHTVSVESIPPDTTQRVEARPSQESVRRMGRIEVRASRENTRLDLMGISTQREMGVFNQADEIAQGLESELSTVSTNGNARRSRYIRMLKEPSGFRDAVVLSEILRRPSPRRRRR